MPTRLQLRLRLAFAVLLLLALDPILLKAQAPKASAPASAGPSVQEAIAMGEKGRCREALPALRKSSSIPDKELKRKAGLLGLRCALGLDQREAAAEFLRSLQKDFSADPEVLYVIVHAYSDLSSRAASDLAQKAPHSIPARELNAEALETQGKWEAAEKEYQSIVGENPNQSGIHFRLGRLYLSKPGLGPDAVERGKQEFLKELEINPNNAGAEYILGELSRQENNWEEAIGHFTRASKLDPSLGEAFLGLGFANLSAKHYAEAVAPLEVAVKLQAGNPAAHYNLALAYSRTGRKEEADKEFAIHRQLTGGAATGGATPQAANP